MKIYEIGPLDGSSEFLPTKSEAIARAKGYGEYVIEHEIGKLTKSVACKLASGHGFSISHREVWNDIS
jgi:hypothetical protein